MHHGADTSCTTERVSCVLDFKNNMHVQLLIMSVIYGASTCSTGAFTVQPYGQENADHVDKGMQQANNRGQTGPAETHSATNQLGVCPQEASYPPHDCGASFVQTQPTQQHPAAKHSIML
jgi:hypothetical protein